MRMIIICYDHFTRKKYMLRLALPLLLLPMLAFANDEEIKLSIRDHRFEPATLKLPAGRKIKLIVENRDVTPEEFESHDLNREKIITPGASATLFVGPLRPGRYEFFGDFNPKTARGVIVAR